MSNDSVFEELSKKLLEHGLYQELQPLVLQLQEESEQQLERLLDLNRQTREKLDQMTLMYNDLERSQQPLVVLSNNAKKRNPQRSKSIKSGRKDKENIPVENALEIEMARQLEREERRLHVFQQLTDRTQQQTQYLQNVLNELMAEQIVREEDHHTTVDGLVKVLEQRDHEISKYRTVLPVMNILQCLRMLIDATTEMRRECKRLIPTPATDCIQSISEASSSIESCNNVVSQLNSLMYETHQIISDHQMKNQRLENENKQLQQLVKEFQEQSLRKEMKKREDSGGLVPNLSHIFKKHQLVSMEQEIAKLKSDQAQSTQLFARALDDLERVQQENEQLESMLSGSQSKHFVSPRYFSHHKRPRYQTLFEYRSPNVRSTNALPPPHSCKNSYSSRRESHFGNTGAPIDQLMDFLDQLLHEGFEMFEQRARQIQFPPGQFKVCLLWERMRAVLQIFDGYLTSSRQIFELVESFVAEASSLLELQHKRSSLNPGGSLHVLMGTAEERFEELGFVLQQVLKGLHNFKIKGERGSCLIEQHNRKLNFYSQRASHDIIPQELNEYSQQIINEVGKAANRLIALSTKRDKGIVTAVDDLIAAQKIDQYSITGDPSLKRYVRNMQTSTSRMLMTLFQTYKDDLLTVANLLYAFSRGWKEVATSPKERVKQEGLSEMIGQIEEGLSRMERGQLGKLITKELMMLSRIRM